LKTKVTYIVSDIDKAVSFEWISEEINREKIELSFILINKTPKTHLYSYLKKNNISVFQIYFSGKKNLPIAIFNCYQLLKKIKPDVVHCHLFIGNIVGLTAAKLTNIKKRVFTRHHATYHHTYFPKSVKWDKYCNFLATDIVAISENVKNVLINLENVPTNKITKIYHGFKLDDFSKKNTSLIIALSQKYNPQNKFPVIGVISRFFELKGVQYIVPAFKKLLAEYPNALLLLFNTEGNYVAELDLLLNELPESSFKKQSFENEITSLYHLFDLFVHVPINKNIEAFGQIYVEALAAGVPSIFTLSGVANEFIIHKENAIIVPFCDSNSIYLGMKELLFDEQLRNRIIKKGQEDVKKIFYLSNMVKLLEDLYEK
jgi:glycosyltransferase involved in cell wall biosynthesis